MNMEQGILKEEVISLNHEHGIRNFEGRSNLLKS